MRCTEWPNDEWDPIVLTTKEGQIMKGLLIAISRDPVILVPALVSHVVEEDHEVQRGAPKDGDGDQPAKRPRLG